MAEDALDEAVAEVIEEEVNEIVESVDADDEDETETEVAESEETAKEEPEPSESSPEKKDDGFQKRIDELTHRYYEEKNQREHFQQQWEDSQQVALEAPGKTLADFEYDEGKFAEYVQGQAVQEARAEVERNNQQQVGMKRRSEFEAQEAKFATNVKDYHQVTRNQALPINQTMVETLQTAEKGPEVLYYLGKNPDVAASLAGMSPLDAARELGRIEATKLIAPEPSKKPPLAPVPKIKGSDASTTTRIRSDTPESDKLSDAEWLKSETKRLAAKGK